MTVQVNLPDDLVKQIDHVAADRSAFVTEAVKRMLRDATEAPPDEVERIDAIAEELNREAEDVLEYQVISLQRRTGFSPSRLGNCEVSLGS